MSTNTINDLLETLRLAEKAVSRERYKRLAIIELTAAQAQILSTLHRLGTVSLNDLSVHLPTDAPPSRVVSTLVDRKLVTRRDKVSDRRHVELALSALGRKKIAGIRQIDLAVNRWARRKLGGLPVKAVQKVLAALATE